MDGLDKRMDGFDKRMDGFDKRFDRIDQRFDSHDEQSQTLSGDLRKLQGTAIRHRRRDRPHHEIMAVAQWLSSHSAP